MNGLFGLGYDAFIGHMSTSGSEHLITLDLHDALSFAYGELDQAYRDLCAFTKRGRRVLLNCSPGYLEKTAPAPIFLFSSIDDLAEEFLKDDVPECLKPPEQRMLYPLTAEEMKKLREMYESNVSMKRFPDPFANQPVIN